MKRIPLALLLALATLIAVQPAAAPGHGGEEGEELEAQGAPGGTERSPASAKEVEEREIAELAVEPARILAQQAIALLDVLKDEHEAEVRVEAALLSEDQAEVAVASLRQAEAALAAGEAEAAVEALDRALSQPLGAESGKSLHKAELTADRGDDTQELIAIILGAILLLLGAFLLAPRHASSA